MKRFALLVVGCALAAIQPPAPAQDAPPAQQLQSVLAKLRQLNPRFDGHAQHKIENNQIVELSFSSAEVKDISPVRELAGLRKLNCVGMRDKPTLTDISPLRGLQLKELSVQDTGVSDLSPLADCPLTFLDIRGTPVLDFSPLVNMPLKELRCDTAAAANKRAAQILMSLTTLESLNGKLAVDFLREISATVSVARPSVPAAGAQPTAAIGPVDSFLASVNALPADKQVAAVMAKLKELNPAFDGKETHKIQSGAANELAFSTVGVSDVSPVRALRGLRKLTIAPTAAGQKGSLSDLSPLRALPLASLWCHNNPISDLTPLRTVPLTVLSISGTQVSDLSPLAGQKLTILSLSDTPVESLAPLEGMPLSVLWCDRTKVSDFSPLKTMPLQELKCDFVAERDAALLRDIRTLGKINDLPAQAFWLRVGPVVISTAAATRTSRPPPATPARSIETIPVVSLRPEKTMTTSTGMELVWIPPGEFMMGSDQKEKDWALARGYSPTVIRNEGENPRRTKIANGFWLGRTEVTIGQWKKFAEASGYLSEAEKAGWAYAFDRGTGKRGRAEGASWRNPNFGFGIKDDHPVCCISWNDAVAFCEWLTETEKKANRLPVGMVCRLPTEAEWEYACRAGTHTMFWWGDERQDGDERVNMRGTQDGFEFVSPVDHFRSRGRNKFGLADMLGNLWELCLDDYDAEQPHEEYYKNSLPRRVERGGSFSAGANWRCAVRQGVLADNTDCTNGFRVCCGAPR